MYQTPWNFLSPPVIFLCRSLMLSATWQQDPPPPPTPQQTEDSISVCNGLPALWGGICGIYLGVQTDAWAQLSRRLCRSASETPCSSSRLPVAPLILARCCGRRCRWYKLFCISCSVSVPLAALSNASWPNWMSINLVRHSSGGVVRDTNIYFHEVDMETCWEVTVMHHWNIIGRLKQEQKSNNV